MSCCCVLVAAELMKTLNVSREMADLALQLEPTIAAATNLLTNEITRDQLDDICKNAAASADSEGSSTASPESRSLIKIFTTHNYLVRLMVLVEQTLANCNKTCMAWYVLVLVWYWYWPLGLLVSCSALLTNTCFSWLVVVIRWSTSV